MPVVDKDQWNCIGGFTAVLDSNYCGSNDGEIIIKHYHRFLKPCLQKINVSASSDSKELLIFYGFTELLKIDLIK